MTRAVDFVVGDMLTRGSGFALLGVTRAGRMRQYCHASVHATFSHPLDKGAI